MLVTSVCAFLTITYIHCMRARVPIGRSLLPAKTKKFQALNVLCDFGSVVCTTAGGLLRKRFCTNCPYGPPLNHWLYLYLCNNITTNAPEVINNMRIGVHHMSPIFQKSPRLIIWICPDYKYSQHIICHNTCHSAYCVSYQGGRSFNNINPFEHAKFLCGH